MIDYATSPPLTSALWVSPLWRGAVSFPSKRVHASHVRDKMATVTYTGMIPDGGIRGIFFVVDWIILRAGMEVPIEGEGGIEGCLRNVRGGTCLYDIF